MLGAATLLAADDVPSRRSWLDTNLSGRSKTVYHYRSAGEERDEDFYQYLFFRAKGLSPRQLDVYFSGRYHDDLDGTSDSLGNDLFTSAEDLEDVDELHVYQLYIDAHTGNQRVKMRTGRQYVDVAESLHIDGIQFRFSEDGVFGGRVFFGLPVSYYSDVNHDNAAGASIVGRPWYGNKLRVTTTLYSDNSEDVVDFHHALDVNQRFNGDLRARLRGAVLNDEMNRVGADAFYFPGDLDFDCVGGVHRWGGLGDATRAYSPLYRILGRRDPYTYYYLRVYYNMLPWLWISPGAAFRSLEHSSDGDSRNRNYANYDLTFVIEPFEGWSVSLAGEQWDVDGGDSFFDVSAEIEFRFHKLWEISAGADHVAYEYEQYSDYSYSGSLGDIRISKDGASVESSPDAYTYFMRARWNVTKWLSLRLRGEIEDNSEEEEKTYRGRSTVVLKF